MYRGSIVLNSAQIRPYGTDAKEVVVKKNSILKLGCFYVVLLLENFLPGIPAPV